MPVKGKLNSIKITEDNVINASNQFQDRVKTLLNSLLDDPYLSGVQLTGINLENNKDNIISHKLERNYQGYIMTRYYNTKGFTTYWESDTINNSKDKILILNCQDDMTVDIRIW